MYISSIILITDNLWSVLSTLWHYINFNKWTICKDFSVCRTLRIFVQRCQSCSFMWQWHTVKILRTVWKITEDIDVNELVSECTRFSCVLKDSASIYLTSACDMLRYTFIILYYAIWGSTKVKIQIQEALLLQRNRATRYVSWNIMAVFWLSYWQEALLIQRNHASTLSVEIM